MRDLTQARLRELINYDPHTGVFTRLVSRGGAPAGSLAGCHCSNGYLQVRIDRRAHLSHRLAFLYMYGAVPEEVDHINHVRDDNRWANLRPTTRTGNNRNLGKRHDNTSAVVGVSWCKRGGRWRAQIRAGGRQVHLGYFTHREDAIAARKAANIKYDFHSNHGLQL